jgi:hypothetical protein
MQKPADNLANHLRFKWQRGQSLVEFALILPMFLLVIFFVIEVGRAWAVKQAITHAAQAGTQKLARPEWDGTAYSYAASVNAATQIAAGYLTDSGLTVAEGDVKVICRDGSSSGRGAIRRVGLEVGQNFDSALPSIIIGLVAGEAIDTSWEDGVRLRAESIAELECENCSSAATLCP